MRLRSHRLRARDADGDEVTTFSHFVLCAAGAVAAFGWRQVSSPGVHCLPMNQGMNPYRAPTAQALTQQVERDWKWLFFSFDGRISRSEYWKATLLTWLAVAVLGIAAAVAVYALQSSGAGSSSPTPLMIIIGVTAGLAVFVPMLWVALAIGVKRWHDRNKSGLWVLIGFIPYIGGIWVLVECGCLRGTDGPNAYGPDPLA